MKTARGSRTVPRIGTSGEPYDLVNAKGKDFEGKAGCSRLGVGHAEIGVFAEYPLWRWLAGISIKKTAVQGWGPGRRYSLRDIQIYAVVKK